MSLQVDKGTTPTITGKVAGGQIGGWVLTLAGLPPNDFFQKSSADPAQIAVLDAAAGTFEIYLTTADTADAKNIAVELRAVAGVKSYLLAREVIQVVS